MVQLRTRRALNGRWRRDAADFLFRLWSEFDHDHGYVFLAARRRDSSRWIEHEIKLRDTERDVRRFFAAFDRTEFDLYFTPNSFRFAHRSLQGALPTRFAWVDIDEADPADFVPAPNVLWSTSPGRHQGLWVLRPWMSAKEAERYSKALAYGFGADRSGWSCTKYLRVPFTFNHKPEYHSPLVTLLAANWRPQAKLRLSLPPENEDVSRSHVQLDIAGHDPVKVFARVRSKLHLRVRTLIRDREVSERDRSKCIFEIIAGLHKAGCDPDEIGAVVWANPYFQSKWGQDPSALDAEVWRVIGRLGAQK